MNPLQVLLSQRPKCFIANVYIRGRRAHDKAEIGRRHFDILTNCIDNGCFPWRQERRLRWFNHQTAVMRYEGIAVFADQLFSVFRGSCFLSDTGAFPLHMTTQIQWSMLDHLHDWFRQYRTALGVSVFFVAFLQQKVNVCRVGPTQQHINWMDYRPFFFPRGHRETNTGVARNTNSARRRETRDGKSTTPDCPGA